jgi:hypothetical protein
LKPLGVLAADDDVLQFRQARDVVLQIAVLLDRQQHAGARQPLQRAPQVLAHRALDLAGAGDQLVQRAVLLQQLDGGLGADLVHPRHVVHRIAHQRLVVHHQRRRHAEFGRHAGHVALAVVHGVDHGDGLVHQLAQVLVAGGDHGVDAALARHAGQRADHVVGLHARHVQHLPAQQAHHFMDRLDLRPQVVRHRRAGGLVLGVQVVAEGLAGGVEHAGRVVGPHVLAQLLQHVDHPADGPGGRARGIARHRPQVGHGMEGAVQVAGAVDQQEHLGLGRFFGVAHGRGLCPSRSNSRTQ